MEIKSIREAYQLRSAAALGGYGRMAQRTDSLQPEKETGTQDTVAFSANASFRARLDAEVKKYAAAEAPTAASAERIAALRTQYAGDSCPVSGSEIAAAVLGNVFGAC